jgi:hypothetical protein
MNFLNAEPNTRGAEQQRPTTTHQRRTSHHITQQHSTAQLEQQE